MDIIRTLKDNKDNEKHFISIVIFRLGYNTMYLTTHDKQDFYGHLGYEFCDPVVSLGGASTLLSNEQVKYGFIFPSHYFKNFYNFLTYEFYFEYVLLSASAVIWLRF